MAACSANLRRILDQSSITEPSNQRATLQETDPSNPYEIELRGLPPDSLLVKTDGFKIETGFLNGRNGILKRADYALVNENEIVFLEMKSGDIKKSEVIQQFHGAQCVMDYCAAIGKHFFNDPNFLSPARKKQHLVLLHKRSLNKRRSVSTNSRHSVFKMIRCGPNSPVYYKELVS